MSQESLPKEAWIAYECDPGGQYLHLSRVFELSEHAEKYRDEQNEKLKYEDICYGVCQIYFAPRDRWAESRMKFHALRLRLQEAQSEIGRLHRLLAERERA